MGHEVQGRERSTGVWAGTIQEFIVANSCVLSEIKSEPPPPKASEVSSSDRVTLFKFLTYLTWLGCSKTVCVV